jgi:hypothetical protein
MSRRQPGVSTDCTAKLTPDLEAAASRALAGDDYETAVAVAFAGVASCLVTAAVEAAIDAARNVRFSAALTSGEAAAPRAAPAAPVAAIERHGQAWLAARRRAAPG